MCRVGFQPKVWMTVRSWVRTADVLSAERAFIAPPKVSERWDTVN
jgi:hypothetical protein